MEQLFVELCSFVNRRSANLVPVERCEDTTGFRSVYMFNEMDRQIILDQGNSRGYKYLQLYSDCLFIDIDMKSDEDIKLAKQQIMEFKKLGYSFELWDSGNRSYHLHIPHALKKSRHLPYNHRRLISEFGISCDLSLYRPSSLFRLPNTLHQKSFKPKELIRRVEGKLLDFDILVEPVKTGNVVSKKTLTDKAAGEIVFTELTRACIVQPEERYLKLFSLSCMLFDCGLSRDTVLDLCGVVSRGWDSPQDDDEVIRAVKGAWEHLNG